MRFTTGLIAAFVLSLLFSSQAMAMDHASNMGEMDMPGDVEAGRFVAEAWCQSCHVVHEEQERAIDGVPTFLEVGERVRLNADQVIGFLASPHGPMQEISLSRADIRNVIAYILSLSSNQ